MLSWYWGRKQQKGKKKTFGRNLVSICEILENLFTKAIISEKHRAAPEGKWFPSRGIEIPCNYERFGPKKPIKIIVREKIKNSECLSPYSYLTLSSI